ncbi:SCO4225 family membrane protein [Streptomyces sp. NPDC001450]
MVESGKRSQEVPRHGRFAGLLPFVVTAPTFWLFLTLPEPLSATGIVVGALFQAVMLGVAYRKLSGRPQLPHRPEPCVRGRPKVCRPPASGRSRSPGSSSCWAAPGRRLSP